MKQGSNTDAPDQGAQPARGTRRDESRRRYDPEQTKRNILEVATQEFSAMGLTGARVDAIAERTNTTKRMLYYYFDSKEGLYEAVLEKVYGDIRALELELNVGELPPSRACAGSSSSPSTTTTGIAISSAWCRSRTSTARSISSS